MHMEGYGKDMITIYEELEQGSDAWIKARCGLISASIMNDILTPLLKLASNDKTRAAVYELACQRVTRHVEPQFWTDSMLRGVSDEVTARELYSEHISTAIEVGGMSRQFAFGEVWYSPDGVVGDDGLIEVKSRRAGLHFKTVSEGEIPKEHILQLQAGLLVSGRKWIDYISICKGMPLFIKRVEPIEEYQQAILLACETMEEKIAEVTHSYYSTIGDMDIIITTERDPEEVEVYL